MIINDPREPKEKHVEIVSYEATRSNWCSGELTLSIDGREYLFGNWWPERLRPEGSYPPFWQMTDEGWVIDCEKMPEELIDHVDEIDEVMNEEIEHVHCGGCQ